MPLPIVDGVSGGAFLRILFPSVQHLQPNSNGSRTTKTGTEFTWGNSLRTKVKGGCWFVPQAVKAVIHVGIVAFSRKPDCKPSHVCK
jgi:hypothetical protein